MMNNLGNSTFGKQNNPANHLARLPREGEQGEEEFMFRSDCFFRVDKKWYFTTREGSNIGPFYSRDNAVEQHKAYLEWVINQHIMPNRPQSKNQEQTFSMDESINGEVKQNSNGKNRTGENEAFPFRADRYFCVNERWYFTTREGNNIGPFISRTKAEQQHAIYMDYIQNKGIKPEEAVAMLVLDLP